jgi:leader peptidase (prepilin peptidase) / N-methyltransferase
MAAGLYIWVVCAAAPLALFAIAQARTWPRVSEAGAVSQSADAVLGALAALGCVAAALRGETALGAAAALAFSAILVHLAAVDWRCLQVPVRSTLALAVIGLSYLALRDGLQAAVLGAAAALVAWAALRGLDHFYKHVRGRSGLGAGDALVAGALAPWLSPELLAFAVTVAGIATLALVAVRARRDGAAIASPAPFVPGLAFGGYVAAMGVGF